MNRPIKFRIWDKVGKVFRGNLNKFLINAQTGELEVWAFSDLYDEWYNTHERDDNLAIQQFTGLTDKNGREVYEGDIVSRKICRNSFVDPSVIEQRKLIEFDPYCGYGLTSGEKDIPYGWLWEVIGNRFENPELLKTT